VGDWFRHWLNTIAVPPRVTVNTHDGYRIDVEKHLIPGLGAHWLDKLEPEHLELLYAKMQDSGLSAGTAHHVHRTARNALNEAMRRGHLIRNPAVQAKAPAISEEEVEPYEVAEVQRLLETAAQRRNSARWAVALSLGLRQGEALGRKWDDVDLDRGAIRIRRSRVRPRHEHGCGGTCGSTPGLCPHRRAAQPQHRLPRVEAVAQGRRAARGKAARCPAHGGHRALDPAPARTDGDVAMGWSSTDMAKRYQHVTDTVRADVASQVGDLIWKARSQRAGHQTVLARRDSLAAILPLVEDAVVQEAFDDLDLVELQTALTDLRTAMSGVLDDHQGEGK